ncbi:MAG: hypothetical protein JXB03_10615 [Spirochaetales bacterium]|nr:hypothetical protein [Spirochaetales bacterium]
MKREEFIATIGYQGDTAITDKNFMSEVKSMNTSALLEKGLFKAAFCSAIYHTKDTGDASEEQLVLDAYNVNKGVRLTSVDALKRIFGVFGIPEEIAKINGV